MGLKYNSNIKVAIDLSASSVEVNQNTNLQQYLDNKDALLQTTYIDVLYEASNILELSATLQNNLEINKWL